MLELEVNSTDGGIEKHVPIIHKDGKKVTVEVGIIAHPMVKEHYIEWIALKTDSGVQINYLQPGEKPEAKFTLTDETSTLVAYEYCNQHGLWKSKE
jgi:superoxide reductase